MIEYFRSAFASPPHEITPRSHQLGPEWWHHHGIKMRIDQEYNGKLFLKSSAAETSIHQASIANTRLWRVNWRVVFSANSGVDGTLHMTDKNLAQAFNLDNSLDPSGEWMIRKYGGTTACQGLFIRYRNFLNIPGPGTGHDGDPNVSIALDDEMIDAVAHLLSDRK